MPHESPLVVLDNVSLSTSAGVPGLGFCSVRLLDRVSLSVFPGDLVLLRGGFDHGGAALLRVLAGDDRVCDNMRGTRAALPQLIVRVAPVPSLAIESILKGWTIPARPPRTAAVAEYRPPQLMLLRASSKPLARLDDEQWRTWSSTLRNRGTTMVIADSRTLLRQDVVSLPVMPRTASSRFRSWYDDTGGTGATHVREAPVECHCQPPVIRIMQLAFGRLYSEQVHARSLCGHCRQRLTPLVS